MSSTSVLPVHNTDNRRLDLSSSMHTISEQLQPVVHHFLEYISRYSAALLRHLVIRSSLTETILFAFLSFPFVRISVSVFRNSFHVHIASSTETTLH